MCEGIVGRSIAAPGSLRERLAEAAARRLDGPGGREQLPDLALAPGSGPVLEAARASARSALVLGRRAGLRPGTSASRRAALPSAAAPELADAAEAAGEPAVDLGPPVERRSGSSTRRTCSGAPLALGESRGGMTTDRSGASRSSGRSAGASVGAPGAQHESSNCRPPPERLPHVAGDFFSSGRPAPATAEASATTDRLPILMYHRVAEAGAAATARYGVTPAAFDEQLRYLREAGFRGVELDEWSEAMELRRPLPGRAIMITFDHGYRDFLDQAWPLLQRHSFSATVFLVSDLVGRSNAWDSVHGEELPLLTWDEIRELSRAGVGFGAHSASHPRLTGLGPAGIARGRRSRAALQRGLGRPVTAFAYPHGDNDATVRHLVGACGFAYGLTCRREWSAFGDDLLDLPRMEIDGSDTLETFVAKLSPAEPTRSKRLTVSSVG